MTRRTCQVCRKPFEAKRDARTCSTSCRSRARSLPEVRAYVLRNAKRVLSDVAEAYVAVPDDEWNEVFADLGQHLAAEIERIGQEVSSDA